MDLNSGLFMSPALHMQGHALRCSRGYCISVELIAFLPQLYSAQPFPASA